MQNDAFRKWLIGRGYAAKTVESHLARLKRVERAMPELGLLDHDLDSAFDRDSLAGVITALERSATEASQGRKPPVALVPSSENYDERLASALRWTIQYRDFRAGAGPTTTGWPELEVLRERYLALFPDFIDFSQDEGRYWEEERRYKDIILDKVREIIASDVNDDHAGRAIYRALIPNKGPMLGWQTDDAFHRVHPEMGPAFYSAIGNLARSQAPLIDAVSRTVSQFASLRKEGAQGLAIGQQLAIALTVVAFARPDEIGPFKPTKARMLSERLAGRRLFTGNMVDPDDLKLWFALNDRIFAAMRDEWGWQPRDMLDVQGFTWVALGDDDVKDADRIRAHALENYILPARTAGEAEVAIHVRAVDEAVGGKGHWRNVCSALRSRKFLEMAEVRPPRRIGAEESPATQFIFSLSVMEIALPYKSASAPTNLILYGPPGTGKTYTTAREAVALCDGSVHYPETTEGRMQLMARYHELAEAGQIEFVTFHQNFSYEDFVEGLRPVQGDDAADGDEPSSAGFHLKPEPGIFHRIARRAETSTGPGTAQFKIGDRQVFKMSIGEASNPEDAHLFEEALASGYTLLGFGEIDWSDARFANRDAIIEAVRADGTHDKEPTAHSGSVQMPFIFRSWVQQGDLIIVSKGNGRFRAIGEVVGDYQYHPREGGGYAHRRAVHWLWVDRQGVPVEEIYARRFSMKSIYLLTPEDLNVPALERYISSQLPGVATDDASPEPFVLIIDEINRANISKVFGELITLLEADKRIDAPNELRVRLPYSKAMFGVPANLHIIGTMNTADRSIALLDTALRRRFAFRELMPNPDVLKVVGGIDLPKLLTTLNERIEYLFDREHQIGHAYFVSCQDKADVDAVMRDKIIPLLAEYFYEDWSRVAAVLGDADGAGRFITRSEIKPPPGLEEIADSGPRWRWRVHPEKDGFAADAYQAFK